MSSPRTKPDAAPTGPARAGIPTSEDPTVNLRVSGAVLAPGRQALQPYPSLGALRDRLVETWPSYEVLKTHLEAQETVHDADHIEQGPDGQWYRLVTRQTGQRFTDEHGNELLEQVSMIRYVALDRKVAVRTSTDTHPVDFWNGLCWMRSGYKPVKDLVVLEGPPVLAGSVTYKRASARAAAAYQTADRRARSHDAVVPVLDHPPTSSREE